MLSSLATAARLFLFQTLLEFFDLAAAIDDALFPGEERVAFGADFDPDLLFGGAGFERLATSAGYFDFIVLRMDSFLQRVSPLLLFPIL
jgi:hypothetical protein